MIPRLSQFIEHPISLVNVDDAFLAAFSQGVTELLLTPQEYAALVGWLVSFVKFTPEWDGKKIWDIKLTIERT